jgi:hypothetical protein
MDYWRQLSIVELLRWLEDQNSSGVATANRDASITELHSTILKNHFVIDFDHPKNTVNDNPVMATRLVLLKAYENHLETYGQDDITTAEGKALCKLVLDKLKVHGMGESHELLFRTHVKKGAAPPGSESTSVSNFDGLLLSLLIEVTNVLNQKISNEEKFPGSKRTSGKVRQDAGAREESTSERSDGKKNKRKERERAASAPKETKKQKGDPPKDPPICRRCGYKLKSKDGGGYFCNRENKDKSTCSNDPRVNTQDRPWKDSNVGKQWSKVGYNSLPKDNTTTLTNAEKRFVKRGISLHSLKTDKLLSPELIPFTLSTQAEKPKGKGKAIVPPPAGKLLLDTGALGSNVMSNEYAKRLRTHKQCYTTTAARHSIITAANNNLTSTKIMNVKVNLGNERDEQATKQLNIAAAVAPIAVDLILDRKTIQDNNLVQHFPSHFAKGELCERIRHLPLARSSGQLPTKTSLPPETDSVGPVRLNQINVNPTREVWVNMCRSQAQEAVKTFFGDQVAARYLVEEASKERTSLPLPQLIAQGVTTKSTQAKKKRKVVKKKKSHKVKRQGNPLETLFLGALTSRGAPSSNLSDKSPYEREGKLALDEIPDHKLESVPTEMIRAEVEVDSHLKVNVEGPEELKSELTELVTEFKDIFKSNVQPTPSSAFEPFKLEINDELWEVPANSTPPRTLGLGREQELDRMLRVLQDTGLIEDCSDAYYSHAFLTPKSNGSWRLVLDFKGLNRVTTSKYAWPIPNIKDMLNRVGDSRPEFFAVFDLTSGYYQAPIAEESRKYTAFKTRKGVYRWKRLPMGLTDAGSYFQHQLSTRVLNGLINHICELYLDDCMVYAGNKVEYLERLRQVFLRFREHKITLNPSKCHLGLTQVEYVGHTISKHGLHFTRDKLDSVLNFPRPENMKSVKSFLGLANYFRDHIKNHSTRVQPLQDLVEGYTKALARRAVNWTTECDLAFNDIRQAIDECPLLWFVDDHSPIFLKTDASDYGIGAYLYQVVTGDDGKEVEHPIGFISKSLVSGHDSWDIPMKEGFAIFYALRKWEYLLRDRKFTILTDHENLTRLRTERNANKMVTRWFMAYQEYDIIDWVHVPGVENEVPDSFSRLCANKCLESKETIGQQSTAMLFQLTGYEMDPKHWDVIRTKGHGHHSDKGHGGVQRTITVLERQGLNWPGRAKDVRKFVKMCPCCQKMNVIKPVIHSYPYTLSTYGLFHTVSVDLIEQLKPDEYGMSMIVVIIDNFSRFVDLHPAADTSAEAAADALIQFTGRFATPVRFTTDSGSNFKSSVIEGLVSRLGTDHQLTKAYSKEQNALVERVNREIISHLKAIIFDKRVQRHWSKYLPIVQRYINTSVHSATGCTPAEIVFPSGAQIDKSLFVGTDEVVVSTYIKNMHEAQARIIALAEQRLRKRDQEHMEACKGKEPEHKVGDYVLTEHRHNGLRLGPKSKLLPYLKGPMLVEKKLTEGMYTLRDLITMRCKDFHVSKMRTFLYDERTLLPAQVAATDSFDEFVIEKVLDMKGNPRERKDQIFFKVRWAGYGEEDDTWVSWKDGRTATAVQLFLRDHSNPRVRKLGMKDFDPDNVDDGDTFERNSDDGSG